MLRRDVLTGDLGLTGKRGTYIRKNNNSETGVIKEEKGTYLGKGVYTHKEKVCLQRKGGLTGQRLA